MCVCVVLSRYVFSFCCACVVRYCVVRVYVVLCFVLLKDDWMET